MSYGDTGGAGGPELDFTVLPAGKTVGLQLVAVAASKSLFPRGGVLLGWSVNEPAGAAAAALLHDGADTSGEIRGAWSVASKGNAFAWLGPQGVPIFNQLYLEIVAGQFTGVVWVRTPSSVTE